MEQLVGGRVSELNLNTVIEYGDLLQGKTLVVVSEDGINSCTLLPFSQFLAVATPLTLNTTVVVQGYSIGEKGALADCLINGEVEKVLDFIAVIEDYAAGRLRMVGVNAAPTTQVAAFAGEVGSVDKMTPLTKGAVKSDGGSSDYYKIHLPEAVLDRAKTNGFIEVKDVLRYGLDNDATLFNVGKALFRIASLRRGQGKEGVSQEYDLNKCMFFLNDEVQALRDQGRMSYV